MHGNVYQKQIATPLNFKSMGVIPTAESCWSQGYDLTEGYYLFHLVCNTAIKKTPELASRFFYSVLPSYGSFLHTCTGMLRTRENNRKYLYASCISGNKFFARLKDFVFTQKINITDCQNDIVNDQGILKCSDNEVKPRHILTGSYLESCNASDSIYDEDAGTLKTLCRNNDGYFPFEPTLENVGSCMGVGNDIVLKDGKLECESAPNKKVTEHIASKFLPAGNYLATCRNMSFFPCMGESGHGVLVAECADLSGHFIETRLEDRGGTCSMSGMGYVSNINGQLTCDEDILFEDEDPTDGSMLQGDLQCNPSTIPADH